MKSSAVILPRILVAALVFGSGPALSVLGETWVRTTAPVTNWSRLSCSADGSKIAAATAQGPIYISTNGGVSWTESGAPIAAWSSIVSSADGKTLAAAAAGVGPSAGSVYTSTDGGVSWLLFPTPQPVYPPIVMSADGTRIVAPTRLDPYLRGTNYVSSDSGRSWSPRPGFAAYSGYSIACSAEGTTLAYAGNGIEISTDFGDTWQDSTPPGGGGKYRAVALSADGSTILTAGFPMWDLGLYFSSNRGLAWTKANLPTTGYWYAATSADGRKFVAVSYEGALSISTNSGATWVDGPPPPRDCWAFALTADGTKLVAAVSGGGIYLLQSIPSPRLDISPVGTALTVSWLVPSAPFSLQQSTSPELGLWQDVEELPALNCSNLHCEVTTPLGAGPMFYRLLSR